MKSKETPIKLVCRCGFEWTPIIPNPRVCPRCKSYDWNKGYKRPPIKKGGQE